MLRSDQLANRVRRARKALGLTQKELARRAAVSTRLVAEVERGERQNVSMATMLRLLGQAGLSLLVTDAKRVTQSRYDLGTRASGRALRVAERRATWGGRQLRLAEEGLEDPAVQPGARRLAAVTLVSAQAFAVARGRLVRRQVHPQVHPQVRGHAAEPRRVRKPK